MSCRVKMFRAARFVPGWWLLVACLWVGVLMPGQIQAQPGSALHFDGAAGFVQGPTDAALNPYPFTVTAWFRTTNTTGVRGIASKIVDQSIPTSKVRGTSRRHV